MVSGVIRAVGQSEFAETELRFDLSMESKHVLILQGKLMVPGVIRAVRQCEFAKTGFGFDFSM